MDTPLSAEESEVPTFVNHMLEQMWPTISDYTTRLIANVIEPAIQRSLGSLGSNFGFDIEGCHLGSQPVRFTQMWAHRAVQASDGGNLDNIVVRGSLEWEGDISISTRFGRIPVGIQGVSLKGVLVIECVGMMPQPPMFQGVRVFFINPPSLDLQFQGHLTKLLSQRAIKRNILRVMSDQVSKKLVVPNRMGFLLDQKADFFRIQQPRPAGMLKLSVVRAEGLLPMDTHFFRPRNSDPYVVVRCGAEVFRSPTVTQTLAPHFGFQVQLQIASMRHQIVRIELWDEDSFKHDDFLGAMNLSLLNMVSWGDREVCLGIQDDAGNKGERGKLWLRAEWKPLLLDQEGAKTEGAGLVFAGVYSASHVPWEADGTRYWVTASCNHLLPGSSSEQQGLQTSPVLERERRTDDVDMQTVVARIRRKVELLQRYGMEAEDMAELLEVDAATLKSCVLRNGACDAATASSFVALQATQSHTLTFNHAYEFLVHRTTKTAVTLELWSQSPSSRAKVLGKCQVAVADLVHMPDCTSVMAVPLPGTDIVLRLRMQLRFLGSRRVLC